MHEYTLCKAYVKAILERLAEEKTTGPGQESS